MTALPTNQSVFTNSVRYLLRQGVPSIEESSGQCKYRSDDGCRCAIGAILPDHLYRRDMEGQRVSLILQERRATNKYFLDVDRVLLSDMQTAHDKAAIENRREDWLPWWKIKIATVAAVWELTLPEEFHA